MQLCIYIPCDGTLKSPEFGLVIGLENVGLWTHIFGIREKAYDWCSNCLTLHLLQSGAKIQIQIKSIIKQPQIQSCALSLLSPKCKNPKYKPKIDLGEWMNYMGT